MAAPGTLTHVLEVAAALRVVADTHAAAIQQAAAAAVRSPQDGTPPPPPA
jgi:hypothetical protein